MYPAFNQQEKTQFSVNGQVQTALEKAAFVQKCFKDLQKTQEVQLKPTLKIATNSGTLEAKYKEMRGDSHLQYQSNSRKTKWMSVLQPFISGGSRQPVKASPRFTSVAYPAQSLSLFLLLASSIGISF